MLTNQMSPMQNYFIKDGYQLNLTEDNQPIEQYNAIPNNKTYQISCYKLAAQIIRKQGLGSCIELGSGSGYKLNKYIAPCVDKAVGIDMQHSAEHCRIHYPEVEWVSDNFDNPVNTISQKFDLVISFDVIEHLVYPEKLLEKMKSYSKPDAILLLSTPERDCVWGKQDYGPSKNKKHVREWNQVEFNRLLENFGLSVLESHMLFDQELNMRDYIWAIRHAKLARAKKTCQLAVCSLKYA